MVEHHIHDHANLVRAKGVHRRFQLLFVAIFGGTRAFLIELAQIKQIVTVIADGIAAGFTFISRRQPDVGDADFSQFFRSFGGFGPEFTAVGIIPMEELQQGRIRHVLAPGVQAGI